MGLYLSPETLTIGIIIMILIGYIWGRRSGLQEGFRQGLAFGPLEVRRQSLSAGYCSICSPQCSCQGSLLGKSPDVDESLSGEVEQGSS
jgi:hypothetical protein